MEKKGIPLSLRSLSIPGGIPGRITNTTGPRINCARSRSSRYLDRSICFSPRPRAGPRPPGGLNRTTKESRFRTAADRTSTATKIQKKKPPAREISREKLASASLPPPHLSDRQWHAPQLNNASERPRPVWRDRRRIRVPTPELYI